LIETVLARDVLQMQTVTKPALLRHLFGLAAQYPAQVFSYNKMLGQLQDAGNTVTLAAYLRLLETAFLASGLEQYSQGRVRKRGSSPKLVLWNNALVTAMSRLTFDQTFADGPWWGRLVENAVGAHLLNQLQGPEWSVTYWREKGSEVDFVVAHGAHIWAVEVKSGRSRESSGISTFLERYPKARPWLIGGPGVPLEDFFSRPAEDWFQ
jgi:predicted AAA+ superfamily ATPase